MNELRGIRGYGETDAIIKADTGSKEKIHEDVLISKRVGIVRVFPDWTV